MMLEHETRTNPVIRISRGLRPAVSLFVACVFWLAQMQLAHAAIDNTARAVGIYNGTGVFSSPATASVPVIPANPLIEVNKAGVLNDDDGTPGLTAGDTISYTITVTNPGNVSLTGVNVTDPLVSLSFQGGDADNDFRLDPTETWTYGGSYTITNFDLATRGGGDDDIDNTVTVRSNESPDDTDSQETRIDPNVSMAVSKVGTLNDDDGTPGLSAGDSISYEITINNNGTADLTNVNVTDVLEQSGTSTPLTTTYLSGDVDNDSQIDSGEMWLYSASYIITQANIDDGGNIVNTASVSTDQVGPRDGTDTQTLGGFVDNYTMTKLASLVDGDSDALADAGEVINYTFRFTNTGNRSLANLRVDDPLPGLSAILCSNDLDTDGDIDLLAPTQSLYCTASYTVQGSDITSGSVDNTATTSATRLNGVVPVSEDDTANDNSTMTPTDSDFELNVNKTVASSREVLPNVVEVDYLIEVTNLAPATQTNITLSDDVSASVSAPASMVGDAQIISVSGFSGTGGTNAGFDGRGNTDLLSGDVQLLSSETGRIIIRARFDRRAGDLDLSNTAFASSDQIPGSVPSDDPSETPSNPDDVNPTPYTLPDADGDGSPDDNESPVSDRDGDGIADANDYDPTGYFYCEENGRILSGGLITVTNLTGGGSLTGLGSANNITILEDGSSGFYQFYVTAAGTYRLSYTLPAGGIASTSRLPSGALDVTSLLPSNPGVLGGGEVGASGILNDFTASGNPFHTDFVIEENDPSVFNNNIPLMLCGSPSVVADKEVASGPDLQPDSSNTITYRLTALNNGSSRLDNVSLSDDLATVFGAGNFAIVNTTIEAAPGGFGATIDPFFDGEGNTQVLTTGGNLEAGEQVSVLLALSITSPAGTYTNTVSAGGENPLTGVAVPDDDASVGVTFNAILPTTGVVATKTTPVASAPLGGIVPYTITYQNTGNVALSNVDFVDMLPRGFTYVLGSATINGTSVEPTIRDFNLIWSGQDIAIGATVTLELRLIVGAGVTGTEFSNTTWVSNPGDGSLISNRARATIRLEVEPVFQCSQVIGRVFDDLDRDGYHDTGEPGLGGVRLASVKGLLITTDQYGRYHITCDAIPNEQIGSNYILKLDERTLPTGYRLTSENPRVVRLTRGKLSKLNFAVANLRVVSLALGDASFKSGATSMTPNSLKDVARILPLLDQEASVLKISYKAGNASPQLEDRRLKATRALIERAWASRDREHDLTIEIDEN